MISKINSWTGQIVIATAISVIIQMILPNGKNKKYAEVVSGLYILYVILNPILNIDSSTVMSSAQFKLEEISSGSFVSQDEMAKNYILGLENALKEKIEAKGFDVDYIQFYVVSDYSAIAQIEVKMKAGASFDEKQIREIVLEDFNIAKENILIN